MRLASRPLMLGMLALGLVGCASPAPTETFAEMTFRHLPPIQLLVSDVKIEATGAPVTQAANISHLFPTPPDIAMRNWARDRLAARGASATATFTIVRADATSQKLQTDTGFTGLFKQELSDRYEVQVDAILTIVDPKTQRRGHVQAKAQHAATVREDWTLADRRRIMYELVEKTMAEFNAEMERNIRAYLRDFAI